MTSMSLDELLLSRWELAESDGVMRTNVDDTMRRRIPGELGLVIQCNPSHLKSKRPVDKQLLTPSPAGTPAKPKSSGFNFTKAKKPEFLTGLRFTSDSGTEQLLPSVQPVALGEGTDISTSEAKHFVLVNVAPLVRGHLLFALDMNLIKPQRLTKQFLLHALSISHAMQREDFALGFNSAGAWSSVNHFHLQGYFFPDVDGGTSANFPVVAQPREQIFRVDGVVVSRLPNWKTTCYVVEPDVEAGSGMGVVEIAWVLLGLLQSQGIPHNVLVVGLVAFVFPRQPQRENGVDLFTDSESTVHEGRLRVAVAELSGLVIAGDSVAYKELTEDMFNSVLQKEVSISDAEEAALVAEWTAKLDVNSA